jgi:hypothetical protein
MGKAAAMLGAGKTTSETSVLTIENNDALFTLIKASNSPKRETTDYNSYK